MGIKGIYGEIGPGERIALSKLAVEKYEETGRPLRIAIDVSIWQFQIQAGRGGTNPAHRTFYYRLLRLLSVSVQPLFVFDGPNKPKFKRGKRSGHNGSSLSNFMCKQILNLFGFPMHMAPGEAEAECALLQREGIVDAVLSEDVDTLMFGCGVTLRNWSAEGRAKAPTHVSLYDSKATKQGKSGLDREGMILVALMSGGDYIVEGIPGVGVKVACEAARSGFGKSLCQLSRLDSEALATWRRNLTHEIQTNESKFFRCKHKSLAIPENFPDPEVLGYYTHPVVSSASKIQKLKDGICWDGDIDIPGLRKFVGEAFEWTHKIGAKKFIRGLAPVLLVQKLRVRGNRRESGYGDIVLTQMNEMALVRAICGKRAHVSSDRIPELRVVFHPNDIVGLELDAEEDDEGDYARDGLAPVNDDGEMEAYASDEKTESPSSRGPSTYDPTEPDKIWIPYTIARIGIPLKVEAYEESLRDPKKFIKAKHAAKEAAAPKAIKAKGMMPKGAMDKFVKISKAGVGEEPIAIACMSSKKTKAASSEPSLPPTFLVPDLGSLTPEPTQQPSSEIPDFESYNDTQLAKEIATYGFKPVKRRAQMIKLLGKCLEDQQKLSPELARHEKPRSPEGAENMEPMRILRPAVKGSSKVPAKGAAKSKTKKGAVVKSMPNTDPWTLAQSSPSAQARPGITRPLQGADKPVSSLTPKDTSSELFDLSSSSLQDPFSPSTIIRPFGESQRANSSVLKRSSKHPNICSGPLPGPFSSLPTILATPPRKHAHSTDSPSDHKDTFIPSHTFRESNDTLPLTPSSNVKDPSKQSPRKKHSPDPSPSVHNKSSLLTPEPVNRTINFLSASRARSTSLDLPSLETLTAPSPELKTGKSAMRREVIDLSSSPEAPKESRINMSPRRKAPRKAAVLPTVEAEKEVKAEKKKFIMLRDSLPGTWKEVNEEQAIKSGRRAFRYSQVEVLDLTEDP